MPTHEPARQPLFRLVPVADRMWTRDDYDAAARILDWVRDAFRVIGYQSSGEPGQGPENVYARRLGVDALSAAYRELAWLLDRIAEIEMGIEDAPLTEVPRG